MVLVASFSLIPAMPAMAQATINVPGDYTTITEAVANANSGDTINVAEGTYSTATNGETFPIAVNTANLTIQATGAAADTIIDASNTVSPPTYQYAVTITADGVTFQGFTVKYDWLSGMKFGGISLDGASGCTISDNIGDVGGDAGIYLENSSDNNTISGNNLSNLPLDNGIYLYYSDGNEVVGNDVSSVTNGFGNPGVGIFVYYSDNNLIHGNTANSDDKGIYIKLTSHGNKVYENTIEGNSRGIDLENAYENEIYNNNAISGNSVGIMVENSPDNEIYGNLITGNSEKGIYLFGSLTSGNEIYNNDITSNTDIGIRLGTDCHDNSINYNNIVGNANYGVENGTSTEVDATNNWWGHATGPDDDAEGINGSGDKISTNVDATPWLPAQYDQIDEGTVDSADVPVGGGTFNFTDADTDVDLSGLDAGGTLIVAAYSAPPDTDTPFSQDTGQTALKYIDVLVSGISEGDATITLHYTEAEITAKGIDESTLKLYYWDGSTWVEASDQTLDTGNNTITGTVPVSALGGTPLAGGGSTADEIVVTAAVGTPNVAPTNLTLAVGHLSPQVEATLTIDVIDLNSLADIAAIKVVVLYDSDGSNPSSGAADAMSAGVTNCAVYLWSSTAADTGWTLSEPTDPPWAVGTSTAKPGEMTVTSTSSGNRWVLGIIPGKVAAENEAGNWDIYVKVTDGALGDEGYDAYSIYKFVHNKDMGAYMEVSVLPGAIHFDYPTMGTSDNPITDPIDRKFVAQAITNGTYLIRLNTTSEWTAGVYSITPTSSVPGNGEFRLKAYKEYNASEAANYILTTTAPDCELYTGMTRPNVEAGSSNDVFMWIDIGVNIAAGTYTGTITVTGVN